MKFLISSRKLPRLARDAFFILIAVLSILFAIWPERFVLKMQNMFGAYQLVQIGSIAIHRPDSFFISQYKDDAKAQVLFYGFFPFFNNGKDIIDSSQKYIVFDNIGSDSLHIIKPKAEYIKYVLCQARKSANLDQSEERLELFGLQAVLLPEVDGNEWSSAVIQQHDILVSSKDFTKFENFKFQIINEHESISNIARTHDCESNESA